MSGASVFDFPVIARILAELACATFGDLSLTANTAFLSQLLFLRIGRCPQNHAAPSSASPLPPEASALYFM